MELQLWLATISMSPPIRTKILKVRPSIGLIMANKNREDKQKPNNRLGNL